MKILKLVAWTILALVGLYIALAAIHDIVNGESNISGEMTALVVLGSAVVLVLGYRLFKRNVPA